LEVVRLLLWSRTLLYLVSYEVSFMMKKSVHSDEKGWALPVALAVLLALVLDMLGEPPAACHPVVWYGKLIKYLECAAPAGRRAQLFYGAAMLLFSAPFALLPAILLRYLARWVQTVTNKPNRYNLGNLVFVLLESAGLKPFFALRMLVDAGCEVRICLERDDVEAARRALQSLVSRDRSQLTPALIAAATIESLAENLSDSVIAPLFYYAWFGLPGAALYRLYNTFDAMIGYHGRYEYLGKAAARLDDALNFLPSRLTALLIIACTPLYGGDWRRAWYIWRRDAHKTASPNAGQPMAAAAGALGVQLEKVDHYIVGDREKVLSTQDIKRAERMVWCIGTLAFVLIAFSKGFSSLT
jgi:adenosylcobinamide-phosphate synthase